MLIIFIIYAECGLPNPFESQTNTPADQPSHKVDAPVEIYGNTALSQFSQFSSGQLQHLRLRCEVAVPLAAGGLHALRKGRC